MGSPHGTIYRVHIIWTEYNLWTEIEIRISNCFIAQYFKMVPGLSPKTSGLSPSGIFEKKSSHQSSETISIDSNHSRRKSWEPAIEKILLSPQPSVIIEKPKLIFYSPCNVPVTPIEE